MSDALIAAVAAFGVSEATGVTNVTGLGSSGDESEDTPAFSVGGGPDFSGLADAFGAIGQIGERAGQGAALVDGLNNFDPSQAGETIINTIDAGGDGVRTGVSDEIEEQFNRPTTGGGDTVIEILRDPPAAAESAGETTGRTPVSFAGGVASGIGGGVATLAGDAANRGEAVSDTLVNEPAERFGLIGDDAATPLDVARGDSTLDTMLSQTTTPGDLLRGASDAVTGSVSSGDRSGLTDRVRDSGSDAVTSLSERLEDARDSDISPLGDTRQDFEADRSSTSSSTNFEAARSAVSTSRDAATGDDQPGGGGSAAEDEEEPLEIPTGRSSGSVSIV